MPEPTPIGNGATAELSQKVFGPLGCVDYGVELLAGASSWGAHESGMVDIANTGRERQRILVGYDRHGAPYALASPTIECASPDDGASAAEDTSLLLSLTDENATIACAWARREADSPLFGVGIDLVDVTRFEKGERSQRLAQLLFSDRERELCREAFPQDPAFGHAVLFGIKEAAFKACAAPLRAWERTGGTLPGFEVRHFAACELTLKDVPDVGQDKGMHVERGRYLVRGVARGEERDGAAQAAMDRMSIARIETHAIYLGNLALVVAVVLYG